MYKFLLCYPVNILQNYFQMCKISRIGASVSSKIPTMVWYGTHWVIFIYPTWSAGTCELFCEHLCIHFKVSSDCDP
jgi:hypothetical protein